MVGEPLLYADEARVPDAIDVVDGLERLWAIGRRVGVLELGGVPRDLVRECLLRIARLEPTALKLTECEVGEASLATLIELGIARRLQGFAMRPADPLALGGTSRVRALLEAFSSARLTSLGLWGCGLGDDGLRALARVEPLRGLRRVSLGDDAFTPSAMRAFADAHWPALTDLALCACEQDDAMLELARGALAAQLERLSLWESLHGDARWSVLAREARWTSLRMLDADDNALGSEAVRALACSPGLTRLERLDLHHTSISVDDAIALLESPTLPALVHLEADLDDWTPERGERLRPYGSRWRLGRGHDCGTATFARELRWRRA